MDVMQNTKNDCLIKFDCKDGKEESQHTVHIGYTKSGILSVVVTTDAEEQILWMLVVDTPWTTKGKKNTKPLALTKKQLDQATEAIHIAFGEGHAEGAEVLEKIVNEYKKNRAHIKVG